MEIEKVFKILDEWAKGIKSNLPTYDDEDLFDEDLFKLKDALQKDGE